MLDTTFARVAVWTRSDVVVKRNGPPLSGERSVPKDGSRTWVWVGRPPRGTGDEYFRERIIGRNFDVLMGRQKEPLLF